MLEEQDNILNGYMNEGGEGIESVVSQVKGKKQPSYGQSYRNRAATVSANTPYQQKLSDVIGPSDYGKSVYDEPIQTMSQVENLEDTRSKLQPFVDKFGVGLATFIGKTATATIGGTIGMVNGIAQAIHDGE